MSRHGKQPGEREFVELPVEPLDEHETAFVRLLAEAIASDIRRGGMLVHEPLDEPDEEISADVLSAVADFRNTDAEHHEP